MSMSLERAVEDDADFAVDLDDFYRDADDRVDANLHDHANLDANSGAHSDANVDASPEALPRRLTIHT